MSRVKVMLWTKGAVEFSLLLISEKYGELMGWSVAAVNVSYLLEGKTGNGQG